MKKIMFNDKYGLTQAVLEGRKTQTRRIIPNSLCIYFRVREDAGFKHHPLSEYAKYQVGDIVAIAQRYCDIPTLVAKNMYDTAGWDNKMFVRAEYMTHHIKITNVRVERLQSISEEDCIAEGIRTAGGTQNLFKVNGFERCYLTPKEAYATLIGKVGKEGTWDSNPWVFVYEFELID